MRLPDFEIPTDFQPFDDTTHDADKFANVRDMQMLRKNHNVLLAKRIRRPLLNLTQRACGNDFVNEGGVGYRYHRPTSMSIAPCILQHIVWVTQGTQQVRVKLRAQQTHATSLAFDPCIYPKLHPLHVQRDIAVAEKITVAQAYVAGTWATYSVDIPVPHNYDPERSYFHGRMAMEFCLYLKTKVDNTEDGLIQSGVAISEFGPNWVEPTATLGGTTSCVIYCDSDYGIEPRTCTLITAALAGGNGRYWVDTPWNRAFSSGDTLTSRKVLGVNIRDLSVYELPITDFNADAVGAG